jgi:hypothetical protein
MLRVKFGIAVVVFATALSGAAYAAKGGGGGGGGGGHVGGGGGGGGHVGGGGGGGGGHVGGGGGAHFAGGGAAHITARPAISRSTSSPVSRAAARPIARTTTRPISRAAAAPSSRGNRSLAVHTPSGNSVGQRTLLNSAGNPTRGASPNIKASAVRSTLNSRLVAGALHDNSALRNPNARSLITARAATAGWNSGRAGGNGWWRHRDGGYGWVGPLFWPFAYYDMYDYALWGDDYDTSFWGYGYDDIYAGMFTPYGYDDLAGYVPLYASVNRNVPGHAARAGATPTAASDPLTPMCGEDSRDIAGLPIDQVQRAIQPTEAQSAALDSLANASAKAAQDIKTACPATISLTAPERLATMQRRIEAMIAAVGTVQPPLEKFYGLLNDEQKARLTALGEDQRESQTAQKTSSSLAQNCGTAQLGVTDWPAAKIEQKVRPTEAQHVSLVALESATAKAADMLKASCPLENPLTPPARLAAVGERLRTMLQAVKTVHSALNSFYGKLDDEQKAQFETLGQQQAS